MQDTLSIGATGEHLLATLSRAHHTAWPFDYWLLENAIPDWVIDRVVALPFTPPPKPEFDGRREANNSTRKYFNPELQSRFAVVQDLVAAFKHPRVIAALERATGQDFTRGQLRIEYCQDTDGFWLEPHVDIPVKLFTMLIYLSGEPELRECGTEVYDASPEHRTVATAPYERNKGFIFIPGKDTWHGFRKRPIPGIRKSLIINYVTPQWRAREELA